MREFDLKALQECELEILKEFIRICDKHHLKYYLAWGTLIGAVRHQGFIPWDDDIDVCMPYEDYMKFKKVCETELRPEYFYEDWYKHRDYFLYWAKLRKNNTTCMTRSESDLKIHWGVGMDIFPIIKMDKPKLSCSKKMAKAVLTFIVQRAYLAHSEASLAKTIKKVIFAIIPQGLDEKIITSCFKILSKVKKDPIYLYDFSANEDRSLWPAEVFGDGKLYLFENIMMNCPENADAYLRKAYGDDYMIIPEKENRVDHGDIIVDLERDYKYYQSLKG